MFKLSVQKIQLNITYLQKDPSTVLPQPQLFW